MIDPSSKSTRARMTPEHLHGLLRDKACFSKFDLSDIIDAHAWVLAELDRRALLIVELRKTILHLQESGHATK